MVLVALALLFGAGMAKHTPNPCGPLTASVRSAWSTIAPCVAAADTFAHDRRADVRDFSHFQRFYMACPAYSPLENGDPAVNLKIEQRDYRAWLANWDGALRNYHAMVTCVVAHLYSCEVQPYMDAALTWQLDARPYLLRMNRACPAIIGNRG